ncbi:type I toxin-antitoxin system SymE family toxin [Pectobacterium carotovorum subsp. carotovorum]|nr:type I toxin-antitoxin system SymE family toxin [Pectobacterium carotovorum subsp. carotovorum]
MTRQKSRRAPLAAQCKPNPSSAINLKGRWLEESGFITGMPVTVTVERGRIIIETQINL